MKQLELFPGHNYHPEDSKPPPLRVLHGWQEKGKNTINLEILDSEATFDCLEDLETPDTLNIIIGIGMGVRMEIPQPGSYHWFKLEKEL